MENEWLLYVAIAVSVLAALIGMGSVLMLSSKKKSKD